MSFEILEHTADIGFRASGATFEQMLIHAAEALVSIAMETSAVQALQCFPIAVSAATPEDLLVNWLNEVLFLIDGRRVAIARFEMQACDPSSIQAEAWGEFRQPQHEAKLIVKGVTYHQLQIVHANEGWHCQVFLDI